MNVDSLAAATDAAGAAPAPTVYQPRRATSVDALIAATDAVGAVTAPTVYPS